MAGSVINSATGARLQHWFPSLELERVRLVHGGPVCWFVRNVLRKGAMTLPPYIFYGRASFDAGNVNSVALLAHELVHCEQARRMGRPRFFTQYAWDLARHRFRYSRDLPLEAEAYELQATVRRVLHEGDAPHA